MANLILRQLTESDEKAFLEAIKQWDNDPGFFFVRAYTADMLFADYVRRLESNQRGENLPPGFVPDTSLFAFVDGQIVGRLAIRHSLNDFLLKIGGHIGYGVLPAYRRKGYAKQMLSLSLPMAKDLGINRVLVTCDDNNLGSIKTIEGNGGVLENKIVAGEGAPLKRRYWIDLNLLP